MAGPSLEVAMGAWIVGRVRRGRMAVACAGVLSASACSGADGRLPANDLVADPSGGASAFSAALTATDRGASAARADAWSSGARGHACAKGEVCSSGKACGSGESVCSLHGQVFCADLHDNRANCGACGVACGDGQACSAGRCTAICGRRETVCGPDGAEYCANLSSDAANCGACASSCPADQACLNGACRVLH